MVDESSPRYEGWRVALASGVGVFVSFASLLVYTFGDLSEAAGRGIRLVARGGVRGIRRRRHDGRRLLAAARLPARSRPARAAIIVPCLIVFGCAFASLSLLTPHLWHLYAVFVVLGVVGNGTAQMAYSRA